MAFDLNTFAASAARTATGNSGAFAVGGATQIGVGVVVTAVSGTSPSMTLSIEWSFDGTNFGAGETATTFAAITAAKTTHQFVAVRAPYFRLVWTITGTTPSFTFSATSYTY